MPRRPPISTRTDTRFPYTTRFRSLEAVTRDALDQFGRRAATDEIWALPKYVAEQMKKSAKLNMPGQFNFYYDSAMGLWKSSVLRSEEHTSELQSLMRISYAVFCLKKKKRYNSTK